MRRNPFYEWFAVLTRRLPDSYFGMSHVNWQKKNLNGRPGVLYGTRAEHPHEVPGAGAAPWRSFNRSSSIRSHCAASSSTDWPSASRDQAAGSTPKAAAILTSPAIERAAIFFMTCPLWIFTVTSLMFIAEAICLFSKPVMT